MFERCVKVFFCCMVHISTSFIRFWISAFPLNVIKSKKFKFWYLCCWHFIRKAIWRNIEIRNIEILCNILFWFFFNVQNWDSQEGRDSCLKINKYYVIFRDFLASRFCQIAFLMTCQQHWSRFDTQFEMNDTKI